jgi:hypothetical protein
MDEDQAIYLAENSSITDSRDAWQYLVNSGRAWSLPKWFGTMAASLIAAGQIQRPPHWGGGYA